MCEPYKCIDSVMNGTTGVQDLLLIRKNPQDNRNIELFQQLSFYQACQWAAHFSHIHIEMWSSWVAMYVLWVKQDLTQSHEHILRHTTYILYN